MIIDFLEEINEKTTESGKGSKAGREKYASKEGTKGRSVKARKSRVRIFPSIKAALQSEAPVGTIFSTENADRLYVITRQKWGTDKESQVGSRVAKGFTPWSATPAANWPSIKGYSARTKMRHGGATSKRLKARYGPGKTRPEERRYSGKKKIKEAACAPASKLNQILVLLKRVLLKKTRSMREGITFLEAKSPAWQRKAGKNPKGGLNQKGVASYRAANPGSKLKTAVTTKPSKLKKGSKSAKRRKSFCARMGGMKKRLTSAKTAKDPDSRINKALRKWNC